MPTFAIESNGRLERTAVYLNGEQISGLKEVFLNLDEDGTFDAILQYEGDDKNIYTKSIFTEYLNNIKFVEPSFTEEEASELILFAVDSDGDIEDTVVFIDEEPQDGIVSVFIHIKGTESKNGIKALFNRDKITDIPEFRAEITYRNEDDSLETVGIF